MKMVVLVSKQHKVTTKYKMQATPNFFLICGFSSHLPRVAVETIVKAWNVNINTAWSVKAKLVLVLR